MGSTAGAAAQLSRALGIVLGTLRPGGRLLTHATSWNAGEASGEADTFIARFVFPGGELLGLAEVGAGMGARPDGDPPLRRTAWL
jgi:cyclopropane fatty-acyl-phospholipid synthase-like methyltransferase